MRCIDDNYSIALAWVRALPSVSILVAKLKSAESMYRVATNDMTAIIGKLAVGGIFFAVWRKH